MTRPADENLPKAKILPQTGTQKPGKPSQSSDSGIVRPGAVPMGKPTKPPVNETDGDPTPVGKIVSPGPGVRPGSPPAEKSNAGWVIALSLFGVFGLVLLLFCGGGVYYVFNTAKTVKDTVETSARKAQRSGTANRNRNQTNNSSRPAPARPTPGSSTNSGAIRSQQQALDVLNRNTAGQQMHALNYLANNPIRDEQEKARVADKIIPRLANLQQRSFAQRALTVWVTPQNVPALLSLISTAQAKNDRETEKAAIFVLADLGDKRAASVVGNYVANNNDSRLARRAVEALPLAEASEQLLPHFHANDRTLRDTAREVLTKKEIPLSAVVAQSLRDLKSTKLERRRRAAQWLQNVTLDKDAGIESDTQAAVAAALAGLLDDQHMRHDAHRALTKWASSDHVPALIAAYNNAAAADSHDGMRLAFNTLASFSDARAVDVYADYFDRRIDPNAAKNAFAALGADTVDKVLPFYHHPDGSVRHFARGLIVDWEVEQAEILKQTVKDLASDNTGRMSSAMDYLRQVESVDAEQQDEIAKALGEVLNHPEVRYRHTALNALDKWATAENVPKLIVLLDHPDRGIQNRSADLLVKLKDHRAAEPLARGLGVDWFKRNDAKRRLQALGPIAETAVLPYLKHNDDGVVGDAIRLLRQIGTEDSIPPLLEIAQDNNNRHRREADDAIVEIRRAKREKPDIPAPMEDDTKPDDPPTRPDVDESKLRTWTDATGQFKIQAQFIELVGDRVRLKTNEGKFLTMGLKLLSKEDQDFVRKQAQ